MTSYLIKTILCSGLLLLFYHLFLEKEKMHGFNRWYLLISMVFSLVIPLVSIEVKERMENVPEQLYRPIETMETVIYPQSQELVTTDTTDWTMPILLGIYMTISAILLFRLIKNIASLARGASNGKTIDYNGTRLVLLPESTATYSFFNRIFVNKQEFEQNYIEPDILQHELAHVQQWHTLDLLFIELMHAFVWFNPILIYFKKAIQMNHEFLADDAVLTNHADLKNYQLILINKALQAKTKNLTSSYNYSITKKRLAMMTKSKNSFNIQFKRILTVAVLAALSFCFVEIVVAQSGKTKPTVPTKKEAISKSKSSNKQRKFGPGLNNNELNEYNTFIASHTKIKTPDKGPAYNVLTATPKEKNRLYELFEKMNGEQRNESEFGFSQFPIPTKLSVSKEMFENWKDPKKFGIWIDDKKVPNATLNNYTEKDIVEYSIYKLYGAAKKGRIYQYQLDLTTNAEFDRTYPKRINDRIVVTTKDFIKN